MQKAILLGVFLVVACRAVAQELILFGGAMRDSACGEHSYAWALDYDHGPGENAAFSLSCQRRPCDQPPPRWPEFAVLGADEHHGPPASLAGGAGPYRYYDTTQASPGAQFQDAHGSGGVLSLAATYYADNGFLYQLRANRIVTHDGIDTSSVMFGVGYQLGRPRSPGPYVAPPHETPETTRNEMTFFLGRNDCQQRPI